MTEPLPQPNLPTPAVQRRQDWVPLAVATFYIAVVFALPPKTLSPALYAFALLTLSTGYAMVFANAIYQGLRMWPYFALAGLTVVYLGLSFLQLLMTGDRAFLAERILPHAAGLLIFLVTVPCFNHAARLLFVPRLRVLPAAIIALAVTSSVIIWQREQNIFLDYQLYGVQSPGLILQMLYFLLAMRAPTPGARVLLLLLPLPLMGAATNVLMQLMLAGLAAVPFAARQALFGLCLTLAIAVLVTAFPTDAIAELIAVDGNTLVRSHMWNHALISIARQPFGIGFGQAWSTFRDTLDPIMLAVYSGQPRRALEVANHNSFIDLALRLGWAGLLVFVAYLFRLFRDVPPAYRTAASGTLAMLVIACAFNPMLETARAVIFIAFVCGYLRAMAAPAAHAAGLPQGAAAPPAPALLTPRQRRIMLANAANR